MPTTLSIYIGRQFLFWVGAVFVVLLAIIALGETVELLRRAQTKPDATMSVVARMALLSLPHRAQDLLTFSVLFGGMIVFWRMTRSQELIVARAAGVSVWGFLMPALAAAMLIGAFKVMVLNPLSAATLSRFESIENRIFKGQASLLSVSEGGIWLRQSEASGHSVIHASRVAPDEITLSGVHIFLFDGRGSFIGRMDGETATLEAGYWDIANVWVAGADEAPVFKERHTLATDLTANKILDSFASPETMSFWDLPEFIDTLQASGFSAHRHQLQWHRLLTTPLMLFSMVLLAATFSLRMQRRGGTVALIGVGVLSGFLVYLLSDVVFALGLSSTIPVELAAWSPAGACAMLGVAMLLHLEDG